MPNLDNAGLSLESGFLLPLLIFGERIRGPLRDIASGARCSGALFRAAGTLPRVAYCSVSRSLWVQVALRLASGPHLPRVGPLSPSAFGLPIWPALHPSL